MYNSQPLIVPLAMNKKNSLAPLLLLIACHVFGQTQNPQMPVVNDALRPCISAEEYAQMESDIARNEKLLGLDKKKKGARTTANVTLEWPLKAAANLKDYNYFYRYRRLGHN